jgi:pSer/pThr/pTyr-binding forkhead associated (FHA) protein
MAFIQVETGQYGGRKFEVGAKPVTVGRAPENTIVLDDDAVSSHHAQIVEDGELCKIVDMDSTNGTLLNDSPVKESLLQDGDVIIIGSVIMTFRAAEIATVAGAADVAPEGESPVAEEEVSELEEPVAAGGSYAGAFKPRHRRNMVAAPLIVVVLACFAAAALFFLKRLLG